MVKNGRDENKSKKFCIKKKRFFHESKLSSYSRVSPLVVDMRAHDGVTLECVEYLTKKFQLGSYIS